MWCLVGQWELGGKVLVLWVGRVSGVWGDSACTVGCMVSAVWGDSACTVGW